MSLTAKYIYHPLNFIKAGGTSRGILHQKDSWFIILSRDGYLGIGECSIIRGLSLESFESIQIKIEELCRQINSGEEIQSQMLESFPSLNFAYEMALKDLHYSQSFKLFECSFLKGQGIHINGLIWMGEIEFMKRQIAEKLNSGFKCLKIKIAALPFEQEIDLIREVRKEFSLADLELRLDANGGFSVEESLEKLKVLSEYHIHSIEQPIQAGQFNEMEKLCAESPIDIALDEELIGVCGKKDKAALLHKIKPQYIILKPSLVGGFSSCNEWIELATHSEIGWWATSALESNVGLNAIAQWISTKGNAMPQGLGTGQLFSNNIPSPLMIDDSMLKYDNESDWDINFLTA